MTSPIAILDDIVSDPLVLGVIHGDRAAWFKLTLFIEAWVEANVPCHWRMRRARLDRSVDDVRDVLLLALERVEREGFRALCQYIERKRQAVPDVRLPLGQGTRYPTFVSWLAGLVDFAIRDHVRERYGRRATQSVKSSSDAELPSVTKRSLQSWAYHPEKGESSGCLGKASAGTSCFVTVRAILRYAAETFEECELRIFTRYLEQATYEELAQEFDYVDAREARMEVRRLKERLRAHFREKR